MSKYAIGKIELKIINMQNDEVLHVEENPQISSEVLNKFGQTYNKLDVNLKNKLKNEILLGLIKNKDTDITGSQDTKK